MKTILPALTNHIDQEVTSLCTCWKIVRRDGVVLGFTDHDNDLTIDGVVYESESGFNRSAISNDSMLGVPNMDIDGLLSSDTISDTDLRNGVYNFAEVFIFIVNWADPSQGEIKMRRGWFGEIENNDNGMFHTEVRGLMQALGHNFIESFSPECRADFCDKRCKLDIADYSRTAAVTGVTTTRLTFTTTSIPNATLPTTAGSHRDWRVVLQNVPNVYQAGFAEFIAWDQDGEKIEGGSTYKSSGSAASRARDGNPHSNWLSKALTNDQVQSEGLTSSGEWWGIRFDDAVDIKEFLIQAPDDFSHTGTSLLVQYSDDGKAFDDIAKNWNLAKLCTMQWAAPNQSAVWGFGSATSAPISLPAASIAVPPPFTGASVYVGGTVKFRTGLNAGRAIEIVAFDAATNAVTLFEEAHYEINAGDTFEIAQGCDKSPAACKLYKNFVNFRGEPHVPGQDEYLRYPDASG